MLFLVLSKWIFFEYNRVMRRTSILPDSNTALDYNRALIDSYYQISCLSHCILSCITVPTFSESINQYARDVNVYLIIKGNIISFESLVVQFSRLHPAIFESALASLIRDSPRDLYKYLYPFNLSFLYVPIVLLCTPKFLRMSLCDVT